MNCIIYHTPSPYAFISMRNSHSHDILVEVLYNNRPFASYHIQSQDNEFIRQAPPGSYTFIVYTLPYEEKLSTRKILAVENSNISLYISPTVIYLVDNRKRGPGGISLFN